MITRYLHLHCGLLDNLVDGRRLLQSSERGREPCVRVVHQEVIEDYDHLNVVWGIDVID